MFWSLIKCMIFVTVCLFDRVLCADDSVLHIVASASCIRTVCWQAGLHDTA